MIDTYDAAVAHRNIYRGKNLGTVFTDKQKLAIKDGTFDDLYIGDYWTDGSVQWVIMDINYMNNLSEDLPNNITILPRTILYKEKFNNSTSVVNAPYGSCTLRSAGMASAKSVIYSFFSKENILKYNTLLPTSVQDVLPKLYQYASFECDIELLSLSMIYGSSIEGSAGGSTYDAGTTEIFNAPFIRRQLQGFLLNPKLIGCNDYYWIMNPAFYVANGFIINPNQAINDGNKTTSQGVRPFFHIKG